MKLLSTLTATATAVTAALAITSPALAFGLFGTSGIQFKTDQQVNFTFEVSKGKFLSELQVFEVGENNLLTSVATLFAETQRTDAGKNNLEDEYIGTVAGGTVLNSTASFTFLAGKLYTLGIVNVLGNSSYSSAPTVYSTTALNSFNGKNTQQAVFGSYGSEIERQKFAAAGSYTSANPFDGAVAIGFEDILGGGDKDYNDFQVTAEVPEPLTMTGLALGAAGLAAARRRRKVS